MHSPHSLVRFGNAARFGPLRYIYYIDSDQWKSEKTEYR